MPAGYSDVLSASSIQIHFWGGKRRPRFGRRLGRASRFSKAGALAARNRHLRATNSPTSELTPEH